MPDDGRSTDGETSRLTPRTDRQRLVLKFKRTTGKIPVWTTARASTTPTLTLEERMIRHFRVCKADRLGKGKSTWQPCGLCKDLHRRRDYVGERPSTRILAKFADRLNFKKKKAGNKAKAAETRERPKVGSDRSSKKCAA